MKTRCSVLKGVVFQLLPTLTVRVDLPDAAQKYPSQISGGQQRAATACTLANNPRLIVGDEPTGNLESLSAGQVPYIVEVRDGRILKEVDSRLVVSSQTPFSGYN